MTDFFNRKDTLSIGICNGCQLFMELDLIYPRHENHGKMTFNDSRKHESNFTSVNIAKNNSVMLASLEGLNLGVWISHGGKENFIYLMEKKIIILLQPTPTMNIHPTQMALTLIQQCFVAMMVDIL